MKNKKSILSLMALLIALAFAYPSYAGENKGNVVVVEGKGANVDTGHVQGGYLGVRLIDTTPELKMAFKLPPYSKGALVRDVLTGLAAEKAGIKKGDLIVEFNGSQISTVSDLLRMIGATAPGMRVEIKIIREGRMKNLQAILGNVSEGIKWYRKAAEQGDAEACLALAEAYELGKGVPQDNLEALKWVRKAAELGDAEACLALARAYEHGEGVPQDHLEALKWVRKAAELGNVIAYGLVGEMYQTGEGVPQDYLEAAKWYRKAAEQGLAEAQNSLGIMYRDGIGVKQDYKEALKWYRKAAAQGYVNAYTNLGWAYEKGLGVPQDYPEAAKWYRKAAEQGDATAQNNLGAMYVFGWGVTRDYPAALEWFQKSADQKDAWGYWNLARMYDNGWGVQKDKLKAEDYCRKAARKGHEGAQKLLKERGLGWAEDGQEPVVSREKKEPPLSDIDIPDDLGGL